MEASNADVKPVVSEEKTDVFGKLIAILTSDSELSKKISYPVDPVVIALLKEILEKSPTVLSKTFGTILEDGKIDASDIPRVVLLITQLRTAEFPTISPNLLVSVIKLLIQSLVEFEYVKVANKQQILDMLDVSLSLLTTTIDVGVPLVGGKSCC
jgi:hypothetical protein